MAWRMALDIAEAVNRCLVMLGGATPSLSQAPRPEGVVQAVGNDDLGNAGSQTEGGRAGASLMHDHGDVAEEPVVVDERHFADFFGVAEPVQRAARSADDDGAAVQTFEGIEHDRSEFLRVVVSHAAKPQTDRRRAGLDECPNLGRDAWIRREGTSSR